MAQGNNQPKKFTSIIIVAILILIQGILYLAASIWSFFVYKCRSIPNTKLGKVMHFIYFRDKFCGEILWTTASPSSSSSLANLDSTQTPVIFTSMTTITSETNVIPDMPNITIIAFRTYILILSYGIISGLWVLTALMVLSSSCCSSAGKKVYHLCFTPWIIVVTLGSILDVIATGFHVYDIFHTTSAERTLEYLDVKNIQDMMTEISKFSKLFPYSAIILTCITCRLIIFWLINIIGVLLASKQARKIFYHKVTRTENSQYDQQALSSQKHSLYDHREISSKEPSITTSSPSNNRGERKTFEPFYPTTSNIANDNNFHHHHRHHHHHHDNGGRYSEAKYRSDMVGKRKSNDELNRYDDMSPIAYRRFQHYQNSNSDQRLSLNSGDRQRESAMPPIGYRFSLQNPAKERNEQQQRRHGMENVHITDELRGQLPWSYFNARDDIATAKRALTHTEEHDDIMPPVPVPDYTYHFPKKERPSIKNDDYNEQHNYNITPSTATKLNSQLPNARW